MTLSFSTSSSIAPHANTSCCNLSFCPHQPRHHVCPWPAVPILTRPLKAPCVHHSYPLLWVFMQAVLSAGIPKTPIHSEDLHEGDLLWSLLQLGHKSTVLRCHFPLQTSLWAVNTHPVVPLDCEHPRGRSCFLSSHVRGQPSFYLPNPISLISQHCLLQAESPCTWNTMCAWWGDSSLPHFPLSFEYDFIGLVCWLVNLNNCQSKLKTNIIWLTHPKLYPVLCGIICFHDIPDYSLITLETSSPGFLL